jgi:hypothetical protein
MAENEVLDVGNPLHYRRWRRMLAAHNVDERAAASALSEDFLSVLRKTLRREPVSLILKACGRDVLALQQAVEGCKDRAFGKSIEQACKIAGTKDPISVAHVLADLLIGDLVDAANRRAHRYQRGPGQFGQGVLEAETTTRLEACRPAVTELLVASLRGERIKRATSKRKQVPTAKAFVMQSILRPSWR